jgi:hypothetical protein
MGGNLPYLKVVPTSFRLCVIAGEEQEFNVRLLGNIKPASKEKVTLSTEENFEELEGNLSIFEMSSEEQKEYEVIGSMEYIGEYDRYDMYHAATYTVYIYLPKSRFDLLLAAISRGQKPSEIMINIEEGGMQYDAKWTGTGKVWDNKASPELRIKSVTINTPLIGVDPFDYLDDRQPEDGVPPSKAQLNDLTASLAELKTLVHTRLNWLLILLASLLGIMAYRLN